MTSTWQKSKQKRQHILKMQGTVQIILIHGFLERYICETDTTHELIVITSVRQAKYKSLLKLLVLANNDRLLS